MPRGSVQCSKRSRIATASWSAPKADPEAFRQNGLFHWLERVYPSARASLASERSAARLAHRSGGPGVGSSNLPAPTIFSRGFTGNEIRTATQLQPALQYHYCSFRRSMSASTSFAVKLNHSPLKYLTVFRLWKAFSVETAEAR